MSLYPKASKQMLLDLVGQNNPSLPAGLSAEEFNMSAPVMTSNSTFAYTNTEIWLFPKATGKFKGRVKVAYSRLRLDTLFRSNGPVIHLYTDKPANQSPFTIYQLLPILNSLYGTNLTTDDVYDGAFPAGDVNVPGYVGVRTSAIMVKAKEGSVGYTGSFGLRWVYQKLTISDLAPNTDLDGRMYPGGNDFASNHAYVLNSLTYGIPFDAQISHIETAGAFDGSVVIGAASQIANQQPVFDFINSQTGMSFTIDEANANTQYSLYGASTRIVVLPSASLPEANSQYFNRAVVITPNSQYPLAGLTGELILHYNH